jgi:hypothetical protein
MTDLTLIKMNLQLFAGDDDGEEVNYDKEPELDGAYFDDEDDTDEDESDEDEEEPADDEDSPEDEPEEDSEDEKQKKGKPDKAFQKIRLKAEEDAAKKVAAERAAIEQERAAIARDRAELAQAATERKIRDDMLTPQKIWEYADKEGVTEEQAEKMLKFEVDKLITTERTKVAERFAEIQRQKDTLKADKFYGVLAPQVEQVIANRPDLDFQTVYYHMKGMRSEELNQKVESDAVKRTLANVQDRSRRKSVGGSSGGSDNDVTPSAVLSREGMEMSAAFGVDPRKIAKRVKEHAKNNRRR